MIIANSLSAVKAMKKKIKEICLLADIQDIGFCVFNAVKGHLLDCRAKSRIPEGAKTVIMCTFPYKVEENPPKNISRYAAVPDYHEVCGKMLEKAVELLRENFKGNKFEYFLDNSPIPEVSAAATAGLGVKGDNGLLITKRWGSFVFLGEIVTDLEIECENLYAECKHCGICKSRCVVGLDKGRCLSMISQKKGELNEREAESLVENGSLWGCDICAEGCPHNVSVEKTYIKEFLEGYRDRYTAGEDNLGRAYNWRKGAIERNYQLTIRN